MTQLSEYYRTVRRQNSLVGYWRQGGSDLTGIRAIDFAGKYGLNGIYNGSPESHPALISAVGNEIGNFSPGSKKYGTENQNMEVPDAVPLRVVGDIAIEAWITVLSSVQTCQIIGKMNSAFTFSNPYQLGLDAGKLIFTLGNGITETSIITSSSMPLSIPIHIIAMSFRKKMKIIINGIESYTGSLGSQEVKDGGKPIYVGELGNNTERFNGLVGDLALYNGALGQNIIKEHFSIGRQIIYKKPYYTTYDPPSYS